MVKRQPLADNSASECLRRDLGKVREIDFLILHPVDSSPISRPPRRQTCPVPTPSRPRCRGGQSPDSACPPTTFSSDAAHRRQTSTDEAMPGNLAKYN